jgi:uncharacterized protein (DUF2062 family)
VSTDQLWHWGEQQFVAVGGPTWHEKMLLGAIVISMILIAVVVMLGAWLIMRNRR